MVRASAFLSSATWPHQHGLNLCMSNVHDKVNVCLQEWTSNNINRFGGDPSRLMIHGCSAGGVSISNHLTQPLSWPFFTAAAMESGNMYAFQDAVSMADAQTSFDTVLAGFGAS